MFCLIFDFALKLTNMKQREFAFPVITNVSQVQQNVEGCNHFVMKEKGEFIYATYKRVSSETFLPLFRYLPPLDLTDEEYNYRNLRREIRGLVFDKQTGNIVSRSVHKFFNVNEREESSIRRIDELIQQLQKEDDSIPAFHVLEKLDGSLVTPIMETVDSAESTKRIRWRSKLGYGQALSQAMEKLVYGDVNVDKYLTYRVKPRSELCEFDYQIHSCEEYLQQNYLDFCVEWMSKGYTPLFEYFDNDHKVIIEYKKPFLSLVAIRHTIRGDYVPYEQMKAEAERYNLEYVREWSGIKDKMEQNEKKGSIVTELLRFVDEMESGAEGFVIRLRNGDMYKMKSKWYSNIHRGRELILLGNMREGYIWKLVLDSQIDDMLPVLPEEDGYRERLLQFNDKLIGALDRTIKDLERDLVISKNACTKEGKLDKKALSSFIDEQFADKPGLYRNILKTSAGSDGGPKPRSVEDLLLGLLQVKVLKELDQCRTLLGDPTLAYEFVERRKWGHKKVENNEEEDILDE
jgi:RNA ligase